jgi:hypothetical protein
VTPIIPAFRRESKAGRAQVQNQSGKVMKTLFQKKKEKKFKRAGTLVSGRALA